MVQGLAPALRKVAAMIRRVIGAPDYEQYVAHVRARHPGESPMSREEFVSRRLAERYDKPGSRCC